MEETTMREFILGNKPVIIREIERLPAGVTLNTEGWFGDTVPAGTVVIRTDAGVYKPHNAWEAVPAGARAVGVTSYDVPTSTPIVGVTTKGQVKASLLPTAPSVDVIASLSGIEFVGADVDYAEVERAVRLMPIAEALGTNYRDLNKFEQSLQIITREEKERGLKPPQQRKQSQSS